MPLSLAMRVSIVAVALAAVAPHDRAQRGVGLHRRAVDADPLALDQAALGQALQHPGEDLVVHLERQARAGAAQPGMVGHRLALASRRNSRSDRLSAQRHSRPRSLSMPSK